MASLIGYGNHGADCEAIYLRARKGKSLDVYDEGPNSIADLPPMHLTGRILIGVNDPHVRREIAERWSHLKGTNPIIDPTAVVGSDVIMGCGSIVAPLASILVRVILGEHVHVNTHVNMTRCQIGPYSTISPGATICGNVDIGYECAIGANSTICERSQIGHNVIVAAGAIIPPHSVVPNGTTVIGVWK